MKGGRHIAKEEATSAFFPVKNSRAIKYNGNNEAVSINEFISFIIKSTNPIVGAKNAGAIRAG